MMLRCINGERSEGRCVCNEDYVGLHCEKKKMCESYKRLAHGTYVYCTTLSVIRLKFLSLRTDITLLWRDVFCVFCESSHWSSTTIAVHDKNYENEENRILAKSKFVFSCVGCMPGYDGDYCENIVCVHGEVHLLVSACFDLILVVMALFFAK